MIGAVAAVAAPLAFGVSGVLIARAGVTRGGASSFFVSFYAVGLVAAAAVIAVGFPGAHAMLAATGLGLTIVVGNAALFRAYAVGPTVATALALSVISAITVVFAWAALGDRMGALAAGAVLMLLTAPTLASLSPQSGRGAPGAAPSGLWLGLVLAAVVLLSARGIWVLWDADALSSGPVVVVGAYVAAFFCALAWRVAPRPGAAPRPSGSLVRLDGVAAGALSLGGLMGLWWASREVGPLIAASVFALYPLVTALGALIVDRRAPSRWEAAGLGLAVIGLGLVAVARMNGGAAS